MYFSQFLSFASKYAYCSDFEGAKKMRGWRVLNVFCSNNVMARLSFLFVVFQIPKRLLEIVLLSFVVL